MTTQESNVYITGAGDTIAGVAAKAGVDWWALFEENHKTVIHALLKDTALPHGTELELPREHDDPETQSDAEQPASPPWRPGERWAGPSGATWGPRASETGQGQPTP